jgi:ribosomal RNA methyltransferase Nop2
MSGKAFSDENRDWLRMRGDTIFADGEDDDDDDSDVPDDEFDLDGDGGSGDSDSDDDDEDRGPMDMEAGSRRIDAEAAEEARLAEMEMQESMREAERFELPSGDQIEAIEPGSEDLQVVQLRIRDNLNTLAKFSELRDPERR